MFKNTESLAGRTAYSYVRFSSGPQAKGDSYRRQTEASEKFVTQCGLVLNPLKLHDLGVSAFRGDNAEKGALGEFLRLCQTGVVPKGSVLIVESLDRLSREHPRVAQKQFNEILDQGITIVTLTDEQIYTADDESWMYLLSSILIMARAHEESQTKSKRVGTAWANKRANAANKPLTSRCPAWMKISDDRTHFEFIPEHAETLKEIITLSKNGLGQDQIVKMLNLRNVPAFSGASTGWHNSYIQKCLTNRALYGEYQPGKWIDNKSVPDGDPIPNYFPALISKENFLSLQAVRASNASHGRARKGTDVPSLFSGLLRCGYCGKVMILSHRNGPRYTGEDKRIKRTIKKTLLCDGARRGLGCYAVAWHYDEFEASMLAFCRGTNLEDILNDVRRKPEEPLEVRLEDKLLAVEKQIVETEHFINNLLDIAMARKPGDPASPSLLARIEKLETEKVAAIASMNQMQLELIQKIEASHANTSSVTRTIIESMESVSTDERFQVRAALAAQLRRFLERIDVFPAGRLVTPDFLAALKVQLAKQGFSEDEISEQIATYNTEPKREGAKGSKYSQTSGRFFTISTKTGGMRVVYPNYDNPAEAKVVLGFGDQRGPDLTESEVLYEKIMNEFNDFPD